MKILLVDIEYDYGDPKRGKNMIGEYGFRRSLERLGHDVATFYYDDDLAGSPALQDRVVQAAQVSAPDLIVFSLFRDQFKPETLRKLSSIAPILNWFGDDTWRFNSFTARYAPHFDFNVTTDKFSLPAYRKLNAKGVILSQWAAIDSHPRPTFRGSYSHEITFIGQFHPYRKWIVDGLKERGLAVETFGMGWPNGPVANEQMNDIFRHSKISLNIGNSNSFNPRYLLSHWKAAPLAIKSRKNRSQIKARNFEIPYFGGFQLTDDVPGLEDWFEVGKNIVTYTSITDAADKAEFYLHNQDLREKIRAQSEASAIHQGYTDRWRKILAEVQK